MHPYGQSELFDSVLDSFLEADTPLSINSIYSKVADKLNLDEKVTQSKEPVGKSGIKHNLFHRKVRWVIQSLREQNIVTNVKRGMWDIHKEKKIELTAISPEENVIAASTDMGIVLWTRNRNIFGSKTGGIDTFHAMITSPPYPLKSKRAYGNPDVDQYVDFICDAIEPILPKLADGGSICLNVSNDIFMSKSPARSTYWMKLCIALEERLSLHYMDDLLWTSNKIPGPTMWCCRTKQQLKHGYEHCLWFTNNPAKCFSDNRRVLQPNTKAHQKFVDKGGIKQNSINGDGAYVKNIGDFSNPQLTGTIPYNHIYVPNHCNESRAVKKHAQELGLPSHSAKMPLSLASFLVKFLTRPGDLVVDLFGGTLTTGQASQNNGRHFVILEMMLEYIVQGFHRFRNESSTWINPKLFANCS